MLEFYEPGAAIVGDSVARAVWGVTKANTRALNFVVGAQKMALGETVFAANEILDRACTEMHLFMEFTAKMAAAHSVKDIKTMYEECGQHQIDFVRRDSERLFKHGSGWSKRPPTFSISSRRIDWSCEFQTEYRS